MNHDLRERIASAVQDVFDENVSLSDRYVREYSAEVSEAVQDAIAAEGFPRNASPVNVDYEVSLESRMSPEEWTDLIAEQSNDPEFVAEDENEMEKFIISHPDGVEAKVNFMEDPEEFKARSESFEDIVREVEEWLNDPSNYDTVKQYSASYTDKLQERIREDGYKDVALADVESRITALRPASSAEDIAEAFSRRTPEDEGAIYYVWTRTFPAIVCGEYDMIDYDIAYDISEDEHDAVEDRDY